MSSVPQQQPAKDRRTWKRRVEVNASFSAVLFCPGDVTCLEANWPLLHIYISSFYKNQFIFYFLTAPSADRHETSRV